MTDWGMAGETITRLRAPVAPGRYNDDELDWANADELVIERCAFDPGGSTENHDGRDAVDTRPTIYAPPGADVLPGDCIIVRGSDPVEVDGKPAAWTDPFDGTPVGIVIRLRDVVG